jgi:hypothetical protein
MDHNRFMAKAKVMSFNNRVISAGMEKQWKLCGIQLQPFMAPRLKDVFYKPKELEFGVGVGVKYSFGK